MLDALLAWLDHSRLESYDWWDLWATRLGQRAKGAYVKNRYAGALAVAPLMALDIACPGFRALFTRQRSFPICHAHVGLAFMNLHAVEGNDAHLQRAKEALNALLRLACPGTSGLGWGMKHDWMTIEGLVPKDTPCNTQTAYAYDLVARLADATHEAVYTEHLAAIARHVARDFAEWQEGDRLACGYTTRDHRHVLNANSYRMRMLLDAGGRLGEAGYLDKGLRTLRWVLSMQKPDGSWPYSEDEPFVDTYHTCFVLKNLRGSAAIAAAHGVDASAALERGLRFYHTSLFDRAGYPLPFAVKPRAVLHEYDAYDLAESIGLLAETASETRRLNHLLRFARDRFQTRAGWFVFRRYRFPAPDGIPYLRYANTAMFLALSKVLLAEGSSRT